MFLHLGGLSLAGLELADILQLRAQAADRRARRPKAVILVCLPGGPSHHETYDMKPQRAGRSTG